MNIELFENSGNWKNSREQRRKAFVHLSTIILIALGTIWLVISLFTGMYLLATMIALIEVLGLYVLRLVRQNKLQTATYIILFTGGLYMSAVCIITSGIGMENYTTHFYFIALGLASYFLLFDERKFIREVLTLLFFTMVFLFHFDLVPTYQLIEIPLSSHNIISRIDMICALLLIYIITRLFVLEITKAESVLINYSDKLDGLIENILPKPIADRLKKEGRSFADYFPECSVLFADIVSFTAWSEKKSPQEVVSRLDAVFSEFDTIAESMHLTKIKTMGDAYMIASGIPEFRPDHAESLLNFAREVHVTASKYPGLKFRIGINSGPVVAGIIGKKRIIYDLWGDTVNIAARLEVFAPEGGTLVSATFVQKINKKHITGDPVELNVKGKGKLMAYHVA